MPDIHIQRTHGFGLPKARKIAKRWAAEAEKKFDMACTVTEGDTQDTVAFTRSGVTGSVTVDADEFNLHVKLGFLLGAFKKTIEAEIEKNLDALLAKSKPAAKKAAKE